MSIMGIRLSCVLQHHMLQHSKYHLRLSWPFDWMCICWLNTLAAS